MRSCLHAFIEEPVAVAEVPVAAAEAHVPGKYGVDGLDTSETKELDRQLLD